MLMGDDSERWSWEGAGYAGGDDKVREAKRSLKKCCTRNRGTSNRVFNISTLLYWSTEGTNYSPSPSYWSMPFTYMESEPLRQLLIATLPMGSFGFVTSRFLSTLFAWIIARLKHQWCMRGWGRMLGRVALPAKWVGLSLQGRSNRFHSDCLEWWWKWNLIFSSLGRG